MPDGTPFAFCILQQSGEISGLETDVLIGLATVSWSTETHRFLAIVGNNDVDILELAKQLKKRT